MANMDEAMRTMAESLSEIKSRLDAEAEEKQKAAEERVKEAAQLDKAMIEEVKEKADRKGKNYTILDAKHDFESGIKSNIPVWDEETYEDFGKFIIASKAKDNATIQKISEKHNKASGPYTETTTAGGYLLPTGFIPELIRLEYAQSVALQKGRVIPLPPGGGASFTMPSLNTRAAAKWLDINTQMSDTVNAFSQLTLTPHKAAGLSNCPNELLRDSPMNVAQIITEEWVEAFRILIDEEYFQGDTADTTNHAFNGWEFASGVHESTPGDSGDSVYGGLDVAQLKDVMANLTTMELAGAEWFMHPSTWAHIRGLSDTSGMPLVAINGPRQYDIFGYPVTLSDECTAAVGSIAAGRASIYFGNPKYIYVGIMNDIVVDSSNSFKFDYDQTTFRALQRIAIGTVLGGSLAMITRSAADGS